jgi:aminoglycoside phosphotransferase (APT) family kinase protein
LSGAAGLEQHPLRQRDGGLYGDPHSPLFDFDSTGDGAEWIDDLARQASMIRQKDTSTPVIAHTDWSARNVRVDEHRLLAVYDWDSLALVTEGTALGQAAMTWSVTADPGGTAFPDLHSVLGYIGDYEEARGAPLSTGQRRAAQAAAAYVLAYTARCEHSLAVRGVARLDQNTARPRLADIGAALLREK